MPAKRWLWTLLLSAVAWHLTFASGSLKRVALPLSQGKVLGMALGPEGRVAILTYAPESTIAPPRYTIDIIDLRKGQEISRAGITLSDPADLLAKPHLLKYSGDGRYVIIGTAGSDTLDIIDATRPQSKIRITLHQQSESRRSLSKGRYFRGIVTVAVAPKGPLFGVLTHDELDGNEIFVGSFDLGRITKSWNIGRGRTSTQLGHAGLSFSNDGSSIAVSILPSSNTVPKGFDNIRVFNTDTGELVTSMRTGSIAGEIMQLPGNNFLISRIDTHGIFGSNACIEEWNLRTQELVAKYCDKGRDVEGAFGVSFGPLRIVGCAYHLHKDLEGQVYAASGTINVWDQSATLVARSEPIRGLMSGVGISEDGSWIVANGLVFKLETEQ